MERTHGQPMFLERNEGLYYYVNGYTFLHIREEKSSNSADSIRCHYAKFSCLGGQATGICAPLNYDVS